MNYKIGPLAEKLGGKVHGNPDAVVHRLMPLETAQAGDLTFFAPTSKRSTAELRQKLERTSATAVLLAAPDAELNIAQIAVAHPIAAVVHLAELFRPTPAVSPGVHPMAVVSPSAKLAEGVAVGAFAVIGDEVQIGAGTIIHPHVVIYEGAIIGKHCVIHAGAIIREDVELGEDCLIQNGVVLGGDGFGYFPDKQVGHRRIRHIGSVILGDRVDIGANSTVDRGMLDATRLGDAAKIDNLVMVGHNTQIGARTLVCGHVGISGSCKIGSDVILAGGVGVADHVFIGDGARVAARAGVISRVEPGTDVAGHPQVDAKLWRRRVIALGKLPKLLSELRQVLPETKSPEEQTSGEE